MGYNDKELIRILCCGSVDDGKSTLIGKLLYDTGKIATDQVEKIEKLSKKYGTVNGDLDPALLMDGLKAEIEQGITIDVAYRYFHTKNRNFILADAPGHVQYTRNMATGASKSDLAIILLDINNGITEQTKRHSFICSIFGIKYLIVAVNKMDMVDWDKKKYTQIKKEYMSFLSKLNFSDIVFIPTSAVNGDNVSFISEKSKWYKGKTLLDTIDTIYINKNINKIDTRLPIQSTLRMSSDFRGYCGKLSSGTLSVGDEIVVFPSMKESTVKRIHTPNKTKKKVEPNTSIVLELNDNVDISRGDLVFPKNNIPIIGKTIDAYLLWTSDDFGKEDKTYLMQLNTKIEDCIIRNIQYIVNMSDLSKKKEHSKIIEMNEIGRCTIETHENVAYDPFDTNKTTGSFILIDKITNDTIACGMITGKQRKTNIINVNHADLSEEKRNILKQKGATIWLTGLSGSGKTTIANILDKKLASVEKIACVVDGDTIRSGLNKDLGFSEEDRGENIRRVAELCKLLNNNGIITIVSTISPLEKIRNTARDIIGKDSFIECYVKADLTTCIKRDPKGLYAKNIKGFTGTSSAYEVPYSPDYVLDTEENSAEQLATILFEELKNKGIIY